MCDPTIQKRNKANRGKGKRWEYAIKNSLRGQGVDYERTRDTGSKDEGDGVIRANGHYHVVEAKDATLNVTDFIRQAEVEAEHFRENRNLDGDRVHPVVFWKRRGNGPLKGVAMMTIEEYLRLTAEVGG